MVTIKKKTYAEGIDRLRLATLDYQSLPSTKSTYSLQRGTLVRVDGLQSTGYNNGDSKKSYK